MTRVRRLPGGTVVRRSREALRVMRWYAWPPRRSRLRYLGRRFTHRWSLVHQEDSAISGVMTVWDLGHERRLVFGKSRRYGTESVVRLDGRWSIVEREYWGRAFRPPGKLPAAPRILILGLGGGTMVHLARHLVRPSRIVVVERDPVVVAIARRFMGIGDFHELQIVVGDAPTAVEEFCSTDTRFDVIIDDVFARGFPPGVQASVFIENLATLCTGEGMLVFNRFAGPAHISLLESELAQYFSSVTRATISEVWENELIFATGLRRLPG